MELVDITKLKAPVLSQADKNLIKDSLEKSREQLLAAPLGNQNYGRLRVRDSIIYVPDMDEMKKPKIDDIRIKGLSTSRVLNLRLTTVASTNVISDYNWLKDNPDKEPKDFWKAIVAMGVDPFDPDVKDLPDIEDQHNILHLGNLAQNFIGNMQDFQGTIEPGDGIGKFVFWLLCYALTIVPGDGVEPDEWAYGQQTYVGGPDFSKTIGKTGFWGKPDSGIKFNEARELMWRSGFKPNMKKREFLARRPIFAARPLA